MRSLLMELGVLFGLHLSDETLVLLIDEAISAEKKQGAETHLNRCTRCRARYMRLAYVARKTAEYSKQRAMRSRGQDTRWRREMLAIQLQQVFDAPAPAIATQKFRTRVLRFPALHPALTAACAFGLVAILCLPLWMHQAQTVMTPQNMLARAVAAQEPVSSSRQTGFIRQTVSIRSPKSAIERSIYRDVQGLRPVKMEQLSAEDEDLRDNLATANVNWDAPLSALSYRDWHDRQQVVHDQVKPIGGHLLKLTTTTAAGPVAEQTFTVRDTDFHAVGRTVSFRDSGMVEIAELNYQVLPWDNVTAGRFVSLEADVHEIHIPAPPTATQLDEAELGARLMLNELQADTGEQIQIVRDPYAVEVKGVVETEQRREELRAHLASVPFVKSSLQSVETLRKRAQDEPQAAGARVSSVTVPPSPLGVYFAGHNRDSESLDTFSRRILGDAITVSQESRSLTDLQDKFSSDERLDYVSKAELSELIFSHREKLSSALRDERKMLSDVSGTAEVPAQSAAPLDSAATGLMDAANRNLQMCEELTLGSTTSSRNAVEILAEIAGSARRVQLLAHETWMTARPLPQPVATQTEKK